MYPPIEMGGFIAPPHPLFFVNRGLLWIAQMLDGRPQVVAAALAGGHDGPGPPLPDGPVHGRELTRAHPHPWEGAVRALALNLKQQLVLHPVRAPHLAADAAGEVTQSHIAHGLVLPPALQPGHLDAGLPHAVAGVARQDFLAGQFLIYCLLQGEPPFFIPPGGVG
jgi:hypothetical protein